MKRTNPTGTEVTHGIDSTIVSIGWKPLVAPAMIKTSPNNTCTPHKLKFIALLFF